MPRWQKEPGGQMEERESGALPGIGALAAAVLAVWFATTRVSETLGSLEASTLSKVLVVCTAIVTPVVLAGTWRAGRDRPGARLVFASLIVFAIGAACVPVAALSFLPAAVMDSLLGAFVFAQPVALFLACLGFVRSGRVPAWAAWLGALGAMGGFMQLAVWHGFRVHLPHWADAALYGVSGVAVSVFWAALWFSAVRDAGVPVRMIVLGALFVATGVTGAVGFLVGWAGTEHVMLLNQLLGIAMIGVGQGLLQGRESSRKWAVLWLAVGLLWSLGVLGLVLRDPAKAQAHLFQLEVRGPAAVAWCWAAAAFNVALTVVVGRQLYSAQATEFIAVRERDLAAAKAASALTFLPPVAATAASAESPHPADAAP